MSACTTWGSAHQPCQAYEVCHSWPISMPPKCMYAPPQHFTLSTLSLSTGLDYHSPVIQKGLSSLSSLAAFHFHLISPNRTVLAKISIPTSTLKSPQALLRHPTLNSLFQSPLRSTDRNLALTAVKSTDLPKGKGQQNN